LTQRKEQPIKRDFGLAADANKRRRDFTLLFVVWGKSDFRLKTCVYHLAYQYNLCN
jgi:hypothetical protein